MNFDIQKHNHISTFRRQAKRRRKGQQKRLLIRKPEFSYNRHLAPGQQRQRFGVAREARHETSTPTIPPFDWRRCRRSDHLAAGA
jgi:hypothetical protein